MSSLAGPDVQSIASVKLETVVQPPLPAPSPLKLVLSHSYFATFIGPLSKVIFIEVVLLLNVAGNLKGVPLPKGKTRIVGGKSTHITKYPFIVSIQAKGGEFPGHICGGSLLNEIWVVTAAHCVIDVSTGMPNYAKDFFVLAGKTNINTIKQDEGLEPQRRDIVAMMPHRNFFIDIQADDIALLLLSSAIKEAPNIKYAKLPKTRSTKDDVRGPCTAIGWGKLHGNSDNYDAHPLLQHVVLDIISTVECMKLYERGVKIGKSICTFTPGKDACQMDSGGPLVCGKNDILYGITSFGEGCAGTKPGVFTRLDGYLDWLRDIIKKDKRSLEEDEDTGSCSPQALLAIVCVILQWIIHAWV